MCCASSKSLEIKIAMLNQSSLMDGHKMRTYTRKAPRAPEIVDVQELCRLCLGKSEPMTPIFSAETSDICATLAMRIMMCLGLDVTIDDDFPKQICQYCNSQLTSFHTFKKNCAATYRKLKANALAFKNARTIKFENEQHENQNSLFTTRTTPAYTISNPKFTQHEDQNLQAFVMETLAPDAAHVLGEAQECTVQEGTVFDDNHFQVADGNTNDMQECVVKEETISTDPMDADDGLNDNIQEESTVMRNSIHKESFSTYLTSALIENGILARNGNFLEVNDEDRKTFKLMTAYGSPIIMELVEEDPEVTKMRKMRENQGPKCGVCGGRFASAHALARHARVHSGERPFACRVCARAFGQREVLRRHELLHAERLPFQCAQCPAAYSQRGGLRAHARRHAPPPGPAPQRLRCALCPKLFLYQSGLSRHMAVHRGRNFTCSECSRSFCDKSSLVRHTRVHARRSLAAS